MRNWQHQEEFHFIRLTVSRSRGCLSSSCSSSPHYYIHLILFIKSARQKLRFVFLMLSIHCESDKYADNISHLLHIITLTQNRYYLASHSSLESIIDAMWIRATLCEHGKRAKKKNTTLNVFLHFRCMSSVLALGGCSFIQN